MKRLFTLFLWLWLVIAANAQETNRGFFVPSSGDCGSISNPVTNGTGCLQTTTANGRDAGTIYVYKGSVTGWVAAFGTGSVTSIATTAPLTGGPITTTGTIAIPATTSKVDGYLSSTDWTTFNAKESALTFSSPLTRSTNTIGCQTASASLAGCLSTSDWTAFNAKQAAGNYVTALTGDVTASGPGSVAATIANSAVTYAKIQNVTDARLLGRSAGSAGAPQEITVGTGLSLSGGSLTATGQAAGNYITALTGDVTASGPGSVAATIANSAVTLAKIANASANSKLLGSGASGSGAAYSELTLGTNLSMSGTTLNAAAGGTTPSIDVADITSQQSLVGHTAGDFTVGVNFRALQAVTLTGFKFSYDGFASKTVKWTVYNAAYNNAGTTLVTSGTTAVSGAGVYTVTLGSPLTFVPGNYYTIGLYINDGSNHITYTTRIQPPWTAMTTLVIAGSVIWNDIAVFHAGDAQPTSGGGSNAAPIQLTF